MFPWFLLAWIGLGAAYYFFGHYPASLLSNPVLVSAVWGFIGAVLIAVGYVLCGETRAPRSSSTVVEQRGAAPPPADNRVSISNTVLRRGLALLDEELGQYAALSERQKTAIRYRAMLGFARLNDDANQVEIARVIEQARQGELPNSS